MDSKILDDEEFKNQILAISYNYQLNEEEMKEVIMNTIEIDKDLYRYSKMQKVLPEESKYKTCSSN